LGRLRKIIKWAFKIFFVIYIYKWQELIVVAQCLDLDQCPVVALALLLVVAPVLLPEQLLLLLAVLLLLPALLLLLPAVLPLLVAHPLLPALLVPVAKLPWLLLVLLLLPALLLLLPAVLPLLNALPPQFNLIYSN
jgi:hypothetical protein